MRRLLTSVILLSLFISWGGTSARAAKFLEVPAEAKKLESLYGTWKGTGSIGVGTHSIDWKPKLSCSMATGGWAVTCQLSGKIPGLGQYDETDVFGFDEATGTIHWFATTSRGEVHDHQGRWIDGQTMQLEYQALQAGKPMVEKITLTVADGEMIVKSDITVAGKLTVSLSLKLKK